jgi:predicted PurR-regulated permease PerM
MWMALTGLSLALLLALVGGLIWGLGQVLRVLSPVLWPLAIAGVLAYLLDPLVDFFERKRVPRTRAIIVVFIIALGIMGALLGSVVPQIVNETRDLANRLPQYASQLQERTEKFIAHPPDVFRKFLNTYSRQTGQPAATAAPPTTTTNQPGSATASDGLNPQTIQSASDWLKTAAPKVGSWIFGQVGKVASWLGVLAGLALVPVYLFYFLLEKRGISDHWSNYLPVSDSGFKNEMVFVIRSINDYLIAFFRGQVLVAVCDGILYTIGFLAIGLPYAILLGAISVFLTMIPFLGAIITCGAALIIALVQYGDWLHPLLVLGVFAVVQALEGTVISPKIMGDRVGLHPVTIIIAVMAGTTLLGGILGGILAIPLTAVLRVLMFRYVWKKPEPEGQGNAAPA